jgi:hypothetical protein
MSQLLNVTGEDARKSIISSVQRKGVRFVERRDWAAAPADLAEMEDDWNYSAIAIHNAGRSFACGPIGMAALQMQEIQRDHKKRLDAADIGYHYGIDCNGIIYEGRDIRYKGGSVLLHNTGVIGIVLIAKLTSPGEGTDFIAGTISVLDKLHMVQAPTVPVPQGESLRSLIAVLRQFFEIRILGGHREFPDQKAEGKICPGNIGIALVGQLRQETGLAAP